MPKIHISAAVMIGECQGLCGIHDLDGAPLSNFLKKFMTVPVTGEDSMGGRSVKCIKQIEVR